MGEISKIDLGILIVIATAIASTVTIIITKLFENYQNRKKHDRVIAEKIIDSKLSACKSAVSYYGNLLNYSYSQKHHFESLESFEYSQFLLKGQQYQEDLFLKSQEEMRGEYHHVLLFYDLYDDNDELIAEKINNSKRNFFEYFSSNTNNEVDLEKARELRNEVIESLVDAINNIKNKIKFVRDDLNKLTKNNRTKFFWQ